MSETLYTTATRADWADVIDFANFVFSQAHQPHDFKTLLPKTYMRPDLNPHAWHFIAKQDGRIRALVADRPLTLKTPGGDLKIGCVGTVSVHPYSRGEGHMKRLMSDMIADARAKDYDLLMLGGQRQRYNYFGFEQAGWRVCFTIGKDNVRHCLKGVSTAGITLTDLTEEKPDEVDFACALAAEQPVVGVRPRGEFLDVMHSWNSRCRLVRVNGEMAGYVMGEGTEIALVNDGLLLPVIKALFEADGLDRLSLACGPHETGRIAALSLIAGGRSIQPVEMINVLNWPRVIEKLLAMKASYCPLEDGCLTLALENRPALTVRVKDNVPTVAEEGLQADLTYDHLGAQRALFGLETLSLPPLYKNWFPLPFSVTSADTF